MNKIIFVGNTAWGMYNFRKNVFSALLGSGYKIIIISPEDTTFQKKLTNLGCYCKSIKMDAKGLNPIKDLILLFSLYKILKREKPSMCFFYTIKPNIYGSIAATLLKIPHIAITTGLGHTFLKKGIISKIVRCLYRIAFIKTLQVWFLNKDDKEAFLSSRIIKEHKAFLLKSEGVDLSYFPKTSQPQDISFILISRMLWNKGVGIYVDAARVLKKKYPHVTFNLLGFVGVNSPNAISVNQINNWEDQGIIKYLGVTEDVRPFIAQSSCVVLPSYYGEGIPMCLLEGAAMAKPLITTYSVGCKDVVDDGVTGLICAPKDVDSLIEVMEKTMLLPIYQRQQMGEAGRRKMENEFDITLIVQQYKKQLAIL